MYSMFHVKQYSLLFMYVSKKNSTRFLFHYVLHYLSRISLSYFPKFYRYHNSILLFLETSLFVISNQHKRIFCKFSIPPAITLFHVKQLKLTIELIILVLLIAHKEC